MIKTFSLIFIIIITVSYPQPYFKFQRINSEQGLSANTVLCVTQDSKGLLWIGTFEGLNRYDGYNFKVFNHNPDDTTSIGANSIYSVYEDKDNTLWVGTYGGGLNKFNKDQELFIRYVNNKKNVNSISNNKVYAICEDSNGNIWVGTANGLNKFDKKTEMFTRYYNNPSDKNSISSNIISALFYEPISNVLWIGTKGGGLNQLELGNNKIKNYKNDPSNHNSLSNDFINCIYKDKKGKLWIGTCDGGLNLFNEAENEFIVYKKNGGQYYIPTDFVLSLEEDNSGNLLIGTYDDGLVVLNVKNKETTTYKNDSSDPESIGDNLIHDIYSDKKGSIWIGTWTSGINRIITKKKFLHYKHYPYNKNSLSGNGVTAIYEDREGLVWIGTEFNGLNKLDIKNGTFTNYLYDPNNKNSLASNGVSDIRQDKSGNLWIVTDGAGFCQFDKKNNLFTRYRNIPGDGNSLPNEEVSVLIEDTFGDLLLGTFGAGLLKFDKKKNVFTKIKYNPDEQDDIAALGIYTLYEDSKSKIWIGTYGGGLFIYDRKSDKSKMFQNIPGDVESISDNIISAIFISKDSNIWIGTADGLNKFDPVSEKFKRYTDREGLPNNTIYGILEDEAGNLWISTNKGITMFNPKSGNFRNYLKADGLQSNEFNQNACCKGKTNFYFGGINGFNVFNPSEIKDSEYKPPIIFTNLLLFNKKVEVGFDKNLDRNVLSKSLDEINSLELNYNENIFTIEFAALDYGIPQNIKYAYKLEGFEKEWIYTNADRRFATFTNLNPGEYIFRIRNTNSDGVWSDVERTLSIIIHPPWWKTGWAYTGYGFLAILIIYLIRMYDIKRQRLKHQLVLEHEHAKKLEEVDRIKSRFFANISHEFRTPLTLILGPADQISNHSDEFIKKNARLIKKNADNLLTLINNLLDLSKLDAGMLKLNASEQDIVSFIKGLVMTFESQASIKSVDLKLCMPDKPVLVFFDKEKLLTVFKNLLSNAFKYTNPGGKIKVHIIETADNSVEIRVKDTGIGIAETEIKNIFDRFYQVNSAHTSVQLGTGLGLAMVKELVDLHHGEIEVVSKIGFGTEFIIKLFLGKEHLSSDSIIKTVVNDESEENTVIENSELIPDRTNQSESVLSDKIMLLIVEDNFEVREFIKDSLGGAYQYYEAENGMEGLEKAFKIIPDLIISDIMMPEMDGNEMTRKLKEDNRTCHIPIIILTAKSEIEYKIEGLETGADDYLTKPFEAKELNARIKNLITLRKKLHQLFSSDKILNFWKIQHKLTTIDAQFMERVNKVIDDHISEEEFTIEEFGKEVGMSRSQMFRKIKTLTGKSCSVYLRSVRLAKAKTMLQNRESNISETAYSVGFGSPSYFTHCFKEEFGYSPSEIVK